MLIRRGNSGTEGREINRVPCC